MGGHRLLNPEHRPGEREHARAAGCDARQAGGGRPAAGGVRHSATQPAGDQDGEAVRATHVRAPAATAPPAAPAARLLRQVPPLAARVHVPVDAARLRPGQPGKLYSGTWSCKYFCHCVTAPFTFRLNLLSIWDSAFRSLLYICTWIVLRLKIFLMLCECLRLMVPSSALRFNFTF